MMKTIFLILIISITAVTFGQSVKNPPISKGTFPKDWDITNKLKDYKILAWTQKKDSRPFEYRSCICLSSRFISEGKMEFFIEEKYTNEKPFTKWNTSMIHFSPKESDSTTGYWDFHLQKFDHKPTEKEMYELLTKWNFKFYVKNWKTITAGINENLWLKELGFIPDTEWAIKNQ